VSELLAAETAPLHDFETLTPFEGCMPVEIMAGRGPETLAFGPMRPVGLIDPHTGRLPYAVVQLRQENRAATLYNMVGFQTRLKWPEQRRVFRLIPGLENAEFARFGSMHRNTFIQSPGLLAPGLQLSADPRIFFAGQITGVEGYVESIGTGLLAGINAARLARGLSPVVPPATTITGALVRYITDTETRDFQPMNANFGILPELGGRMKKAERKLRYGQRALEDVKKWIEILDADFGCRND
jgi:methylenetetrahydrofolate--tRNA-(uracil-5-)-methyltransferase